MIALTEDDGPLVGLYLLEGDDEEEEEEFVPLTKSERVGAVIGVGLGRVVVAAEYAFGAWLIFRLLGKPW